MRSFWFVAIAVLVMPAVLVGCLSNTEGPAQISLEDEVKIIDQYLTDNSIQAMKDVNGMRYVVSSIGKAGFPPHLNHSVKFKYTGKLLNGSQFDSGILTSALDDLIWGMQYGMSILPKGSKATLYIPSGYGYGSTSQNGIPANSILVFDIELQDIIPTNAEKARLTSDIGVIDEELAKKSITAVKDTTGVRYVITNPGTGAKPSWYTKVKITYTGKTFPGNTQFFTGTTEPSDDFNGRVIDYVHGLQVALTKIGKGGKITVYIPSPLGFGSADNSANGLPSNSNISYEVELVDIF